MKNLLITGFTPFGGAEINPSWEAVSGLAEIIGNFRVHKLQIPTIFGGASWMVVEHAGPIKPDVILCVGQAGGRTAVTPERIAVNIQDARIPDNAGNQPRGQFVIPGGPAAYFSTVPVEAMAQRIRERGIPAEVSNSAGTFVCNDVLYNLLHHYDVSKIGIGFIHVPWLPQQGQPSLPLEDTVAALTAAIEALE